MLFFKAKVRRIKFWWNLSFAYVSRYKLWLLSILVVFFSLIFAFYKILPIILRTNVVALGYVGVYSVDSIPTEVLQLATQSLTSGGRDGKPIPSLAANWQVSEDGKTYVVFLKDNLVWHDNSPVLAKDISIAISNVQIHALNNKAIEFKLPNPIASFPLALDKPVFKAKSFYGTGKFRIVDINQVEGVVKKISLVSKDKTLPRVYIKFYQTEQQALNALKIGEIKSLTVSNAKILEKWPNLELEKITDTNTIVAIFYNNQDPLLASKDLRQALSYAIQKSDFDGINAISPISPTNWAYNNNIKRYEYNTSWAKELLSKTEIKSPKITLTSTPGLEDMAEKIKKDWQELGIEVSINKSKNVPDNFQALLVYEQLMPDPDQYSLWHSTQNDTNITGYKNVKVDKLLEDARNTSDEAKRKELYFDFQKFLVEDAPAAFLYYPYKYKITYNNVMPLIAKLPK